MTKQPPRLSASTIKRMRQYGMNPENMNEEQLRALESLDNPEKSHWLAKPFVYMGVLFLFAAFITLVVGEWGSAWGNGIVGTILCYIGYRVQRRFTYKRFVRATVQGEVKKQERTQAEWQKKGNMPDVLVAKAKVAAKRILAVAEGTNHVLFRELRKAKGEQFGKAMEYEVLFETVLFLMHVADRAAFFSLEEEKRGVFTDSVLLEIRERFSRTLSGGVEAAAFRDSFVDAYNARQVEYTQYQKLVPAGSEGSAGTLFWEFSEKIARTISPEHDLTTPFVVFGGITSAVKEMGLKDLLGETEK